MEDITGSPFKASSYAKDKGLTTQRAVSVRFEEVIQPSRDTFRPRKDGSHLDIAQAAADLFKATNNFSLKFYMLIAK